MSQVTWRWQPFNNPARTDSLALEHWMKCYKDQSGNVRPAEEGEYSFAKFNKKVRCHACLLCYHSLVLSSIHQLTLALGLTDMSYHKERLCAHRVKHHLVFRAVTGPMAEALRVTFIEGV